MTSEKGTISGILKTAITIVSAAMGGSLFMGMVVASNGVDFTVGIIILMVCLIVIVVLGIAMSINDGIERRRESERQMQIVMQARLERDFERALNSMGAYRSPSPRGDDHNEVWRVEIEREEQRFQEFQLRQARETQRAMQEQYLNSGAFDERNHLKSRWQQIDLSKTREDE